MHQRTTQLKALAEVVFPVHTEHGFALHAVAGIILERHADICSCIDDALVENGDLTGRVIDGVVTTFLKTDTTCGNDDRSFWNKRCSKRDNVSTGSLELTSEDILIFLGILFGNGLCRIVELVEAIFISQITHTFRLQIIAQVITKRLSSWQEDATVAYGITANEVELSVGMRLHVGIQAVQTHHFQ